MLVWWDSTWSTRLWCVFELAAFLKSKQASKEVLLISPTVLGPCSIVLFLGVFVVMLPVTLLPMPEVSLGHYSVPLFSALLVAFISGYWIAAVFRAYFRSVETLKERLLNISFHERCACCDLGHAGGILCDRQVVQQCVSICFGSEEAFEDYARSEVLEALGTRLKLVVTRSYQVEAIASRLEAITTSGL